MYIATFAASGVFFRERASYLSSLRRVWPRPQLRFSYLLFMLYHEKRPHFEGELKQSISFSPRTRPLLHTA